MEPYVRQGSIVREIWGNADTILFIFAGSSAEFALNKAVDWLYFTGRLPADPIGRLFSTVSYARKIVFSDHEEAVAAIDQITAIHKGIETKRGQSIPDWAYRDVLYMLIDYSIRSFEILERKLTESEKEEVFHVFNRLGLRMGIPELPENYCEWQSSRKHHLMNDLAYNNFTPDLYKQYRKHLGWARFALLKQVQILIAPPHVKKLLSFTNLHMLSPVISIYKVFRFFNLDDMMKKIVLPEKYKKEILELNAN